MSAHFGEFARLVFAYVSAPTISSVSRAISSGGIAGGRSVGSAAAGFASVLVSSVIASSEQILRFEQRLRNCLASLSTNPTFELSLRPPQSPLRENGFSRAETSGGKTGHRP